MTPSKEFSSDEQNTSATGSDMNARLRMRRTATPGALASRLFGTPEPESPDTGTADGDDTA